MVSPLDRNVQAEKLSLPHELPHKLPEFNPSPSLWRRFAIGGCLYIPGPFRHGGGLWFDFLSLNPHDCKRWVS